MRAVPASRIAPVGTTDDLAATIALFRAYAGSLPIDLAYQDFERELEELPGVYAPPAGVLLLARRFDRLLVGCVTLRPFADDGRAEMKRLYVVPEGRGGGLGRCLAMAAIAEAERIGYRELLLDTLPSMTSAQSLYQSLGFVPIDPYYDSPITGTIFMALTLPRDRD